MNCEACQTQLADFLLNELDQQTAEAISAHLAAGCMGCREVLDELTAAIDLIIEDPAPQDVELTSEDRRITWDLIGQRLDPSDHVRPAADSWTNVGENPPAELGVDYRFWGAALVSVACGFLFVMGWFRLTGGGRLDSQSRLDRPSVAIAANDPFAEPPAETRDLRVVSLRRPNRPSGAVGEFTVDVAARQIHFYSYGLPALAVNQSYAFWFITIDEDWIFGGEIETGDHSRGHLIDIPTTSSPVRYVALTVDAGSPSPSPRPDIAFVSDAVFENPQR